MVRPFARSGDGIGAWKALMSQYGHESKELRQARLLECMRRLSNLNCECREKISSFVVELDHLFGEFEALDCTYPEPLKKLILLERIEGAAPDVYGATIKDESLGYEALAATVKRMAALDNAMGRASRKEESDTQIYHMNSCWQKNQKRQSQAQTKKVNWRPERDQCLWCLKKGRRLADCQSNKRGEPSRIRPDGSRFENHGKSKHDEPAAFATQCFAVRGQNRGKGKQQSWLVDSGCNRHMTPFPEDLRGMMRDTTSCRFGDNATAKAEGKGHVGRVSCHRSSYDNRGWLSFEWKQFNNPNYNPE